MKSVKIFGKSVPLLAIVMISMLVIGASAYAFVGVASAVTPPGTLTLNYYTNNDGTGDAVTGLSVYVKTSAGTVVASRGGVSGTTTFTLPAGDYKVTSVKGASSRTDGTEVPYTVSSGNDTPVNIPCGELITSYYTDNKGGAEDGVAVTGVSTYVKWAANNGDVASAGGVNGKTSFALLAGDYKVTSVKGASSRTDGTVDVPYTVASTLTADIPCGKLKVTYYANNNALWGMTGVSVYVKWAANMGDVASAGGVSGSTSFALLAGDSAYKVVSVKGASSRTDGPYTVASTQTADIPVARFRVVVVKSDFTAQTGVSVYVKTSGGGDVASAGGVSGSVDFSLLQSKDGPGPYRFIAIKGSTAQADQSANEVPPAGLSGVILMIP